MSRSSARAPLPSPNRLLAALPAGDYRRLRPHLEPVSLTPRQVLYQPGLPISHVYFPTRTVLSLLLLANGNGNGAIEVGLVGPEGAAGLPVLLADGLGVGRCVVQVPGEALRMAGDAFRANVRPGRPLHGLLLRYAHAFLTQVSHLVACNSLHPVSMRLCRWLLMVRARAGADRIPMTHAFLAAMLGVRRASVTEVTQALQRAGLIRYGRGEVTVLDCPGLEATACDCYHIVQAEQDRVLP